MYCLLREKQILSACPVSEQVGSFQSGYEKTFTLYPNILFSFSFLKPKLEQKQTFMGLIAAGRRNSKVKTFLIKKKLSSFKFTHLAQNLGSSDWIGNRRACPHPGLEATLLLAESLARFPRLEWGCWSSEETVGIQCPWRKCFSCLTRCLEGLLSQHRLPDPHWSSRLCPSSAWQFNFNHSHSVDLRTVSVKLSVPGTDCVY